MSTTEQQNRASPEIRSLISHLRSSKSGIKNRTGVLNGKRVDYFKGKSAVKALLSPNYSALSSVPKVNTELEAVTLLQTTMPFAFFLRVDRQAGPSASSPKHLTFFPQQTFSQDGYFAWFYDGPQWTTYLGGIGMVAIMLAGVMFPLWPPTLRLGVWYLSIGMLGLIGVFFGIALLRLIFYIITVVVTPPGIWVFPQLFADVGFIDSFIPFYEWDYPKKKRGSKRAKVDKGKGKDKNGGDHAAVGGAFIEEVDDSSDSRPVSRNSKSATVEEVVDDITS